MVDVWLPGGTRLDQTDRVTQEMRNFIADIPGITYYHVRRPGPLRFLLTYSPERFDSSYAQFLIDVKEQSLINEVLPRVQKELTEKYPDAQIIAKRFLLGPGEGGRIQCAFRETIMALFVPSLRRPWKFSAPMAGQRGSGLIAESPFPAAPAVF